MMTRWPSSSIARRTTSTVPPAGAVGSKRCGTPSASRCARADLIQSAACPDCAVGLANRTAGLPSSQRSMLTGGPYPAHALLFVNNFYYAGSAAQHARFLPRTLTGEWIGAMGMTEPAVGTDVLGMQTSARKVGGDYVLDGRKTFITNAPEAHVFLV